MKILLWLRPSLHHLRQGFSSLFGSFPGTTAQSDSSRTYAFAVRHFAFANRSRPAGIETLRRSPGSRACCFSTCLGSATTPGPASASRCSAAAGVAFSQTGKDRHPDLSFSRLNVPPADASVYASPTASQRPAQDSRSGWIRFSFPVGLFHPLQHAGFPAHPVLDPTRLSRRQFGHHHRRDDP